MQRTSIIVGGGNKAQKVMEFVRILQKSEIKIKAIDIQAKDFHTIINSTGSLDFLLMDRGCSPEVKLTLADTILHKKLKCNLVMFSLSKNAKNTKFYTYFTVKEDSNEELANFVRSHFSTSLRPRPSSANGLKNFFVSTIYFFKDLHLQWTNSSQPSLG